MWKQQLLATVQWSLHRDRQSREEAMDMLRKLRGQNWMPRSEEDLRRSLDKVQ
jgi:hypothetical protein